MFQTTRAYQSGICSVDLQISRSTLDNRRQFPYKHETQRARFKHFAFGHSYDKYHTSSTIRFIDKKTKITIKEALLPHMAAH